MNYYLLESGEQSIKREKELDKWMAENWEESHENLPVQLLDFLSRQVGSWHSGWFCYRMPID